jgi:PII-like signaling protein
MRIPVEAVLLRVFVGADDCYGEQALYEAIVDRAREAGIAGATVLPGPEGFGQSRHVRSELSVDAGPRQPMVVEIVDTAAQIDRFLPVLDSMMTSGGLVTLEKVKAIHYRSTEGRPVEGEHRRA